MRLRKRKLKLPDSPELLLEDTIQFVQAATIYATIDRQSFAAFLNMQSYNPRDAHDAEYEYTFDICGRTTVADRMSLKRMGVDTERRVNVGAFSEGQRRYLEFHRENVLRMACGLATR